MDPDQIDGIDTDPSEEEVVTEDSPPDENPDESSDADATLGTGLTDAAQDLVDNNTTNPDIVDPAMASAGDIPSFPSPERNLMEITLWEPNTPNYIRFPLNPSRIQVSTAARVQTFEPMQGIGTVQIPHGTQPYRIQFEGIFPGVKRIGRITDRDVLENSPYHDPVGYLNNLGGPWGAITRIDAWQHPERSNAQPIKLAFRINDPPVSSWVFIESFEYSIQGGWGDINYNMVLAEWRELLIYTDQESSKVPTAPGDAPGPTDTTPDSGENPSTDPNDPNQRPEENTPDTYTIVPGDTLFDIARKPSVYGDGSRWSDIYSANADVIGPDPDSIEVGTVLSIPR